MKWLFAIQIAMGIAYLVNGIMMNTVHQIILGPVIIILGVRLLKKELDVEGKTG